MTHPLRGRVTQEHPGQDCHRQAQQQDEWGVDAGKLQVVWSRRAGLHGITHAPPLCAVPGKLWSLCNFSQMWL